MVASFFQFALLLLVSATSVEGFATTNHGQIQQRNLLLEARPKPEMETDNDTVDQTVGMDRRRAITATGLAAMSLWLGDTFGTDNLASKWAANAAEEAS